jgi:hypothetical protein
MTTSRRTSLALAVCALFAFTASVRCFAQKLPEGPLLLEGEALQESLASFAQLDIMLQEKMFLSENGITALQRYSSGLDPFYKQVLFERHRRNPWSAAALNFVTGGFGSIQMGDIAVGVVLEAGMVASYALAAYALMDQGFKSTGAYTWAEGGAIVFGVAGLVWPFLSAAPWNAKLKRSLSY